MAKVLVDSGSKVDQFTFITDDWHTGKGERYSFRIIPLSFLEDTTWTSPFCPNSNQNKGIQSRT